MFTQLCMSILHGIWDGLDVLISICEHNQEKKANNLTKMEKETDMLLDSNADLLTAKDSLLFIIGLSRKRDFISFR